MSELGERAERRDRKFARLRAVRIIWVGSGTEDHRLADLEARSGRG